MPSWKRLTGVFAPRWRSGDPATRRKAAMELTAEDPESRSILEALIHDPAPPVREAAIKRFDDLATLRTFHESDPDAGVRSAAGIRYRQLLVADTPAEAAAAELERCDDPTVAAHVAQQGRDPAVRRVAIERLETPAVLLEVALHDGDAENRRRAVQALDDPQALTKLERRAGARQPEIARLAQQRRATLQAQAAPDPAPAEGEHAGPAARTPDGGESRQRPAPDPNAAAPTRPGASAIPSARPRRPALPKSGRVARPGDSPWRQAEALCNAMEALADNGWWPGYHRRRRELLTEWRTLEREPPELAERFRAACVRAVMERPDNHQGEATRARLEFEELLREVRKRRGDPAETVGQRLEALSRSLGDLNGDHPDEAAARVHLQRLGRYVRKSGPPRPRRDVGRPPKRRDPALTRALEAAEAAAAAGDLAAVREHLGHARALIDTGSPPDPG